VQILTIVTEANGFTISKIPQEQKAGTLKLVLFTKEKDKKGLTKALSYVIIQVQTKQREVLIMNTIVTNAEMFFWCVVGVAVVALFIAMPLINNYLLNKEAREMLGF
jgi:hypothetical protein